MCHLILLGCSGATTTTTAPATGTRFGKVVVVVVVRVIPIRRSTHGGGAVVGSQTAARVRLMLLLLLRHGVSDFQTEFPPERETADHGQKDGEQRNDHDVVFALLMGQVGHGSEARCGGIVVGVRVTIPFVAAAAANGIANGIVGHRCCCRRRRRCHGRIGSGRGDGLIRVRRRRRRQQRHRGSIRTG